MKINNLKINKFGKLENKEINLKNKINIIYGKNESGKSTLLKFITSILYGLSKNKNGKIIPDFEKYTPWEEGDFSGRISYELDNGKKYEVFREFKKKNPKIFDEKLNDISKEFTIDKNKGNEFFYDQVKIDEELFLSTVVCSQQELKLDKQKQNNLIQKIANLIVTGDDNISFNKIINKLNKKQIEEIGTARTQDRPINIIEKNLKSINDEINNIKYCEQKRNIIENNKLELEKEINKIEINLELIKEIKKINEKAILEKERVNINKQSLNEYDERVNKINNELNSAKEIKVEKIRNKNNLLKNIFIPIILILINLLIYIFMKNIIINIFGICIFMIYLFLIYFNNKKNRLKMEEQEKVKNKIKENINKLRNELEEINIIKKNKLNEIKNQEEKNNLQNKLEIQKIKNIYLDKIDEIKIDNIINSLDINFIMENEQNKVNEIKLNIHRLNIEEKNILEKLEKISELKEEKEELEEKFKDLLKKNNCINLAKEELEKAYIEMKENISPKFTKELSLNIAQISGGKYTNVKINDEGLLIIENKNGNYILIDNLSIGTIEQLYLSLRLSFAENISNEKLPLMLDESFVYFDDVRLENILKFLNNKFKDRQIIIFTCTKREQEVMQRLGIEYNFIEI